MAIKTAVLYYSLHSTRVKYNRMTWHFRVQSKQLFKVSNLLCPLLKGNIKILQLVVKKEKTELQFCKLLKTFKQSDVLLSRLSPQGFKTEAAWAT